MNDPLAYLLTWTTYGTWLPGDDRYWSKRDGHFLEGDFDIREYSRSIMNETPLYLNPEQRRLVEETIHKHAEIRQWQVHAVNCRTNHVHVVVTAIQVSSEKVMTEFKTWCTRALKELIPTRNHWWTKNGSRRSLFHENAVEGAISYTIDGQ